MFRGSHCALAPAAAARHPKATDATDATDATAKYEAIRDPPIPTNDVATIVNEPVAQHPCVLDSYQRDLEAFIRIEAPCPISSRRTKTRSEVQGCGWASASARRGATFDGGSISYGSWNLRNQRQEAPSDRTLKESVRVAMRAQVEGVVAKYDHRPDIEEKAVEMTLGKAELFVAGAEDD